MNMIRIACAVSMALLLSVAFPASAASQAGKVVYAFGQVEAVSSRGATRALSRGDLFGPGDTVTTRRGRAQLRFTDGGFAALQPNTEYRIEDYHYAGKADGEERSFLNLVRGSVRLVTGIIGRSNKQNFRLRTAVATIGIRGTSGRVTSCLSNCGALGPGTKLGGYGGVWDLDSGSYKGPVQPGQATFCNGTDCFDLPGFGQRAQVEADVDELDESLDENDDSVADGDAEQRFQDGVQSDADGTQCSASGQCDTDLLVTLNQIGASALDFDREFGDTEAFDNATIVFNNGVPVAGITVFLTNDDLNFDEGPIGFVTTDAAALRQALIDFPDAEISALGLNILDAIPLSQLQDLASMPATVGEGDFGLTSDGLLLHGRWQDGYILDGDVSADGTELFTELRLLSGSQSEHFIIGADPGVLPSSGQATYGFTGGTFSTAGDGSSIGLGVTAGSLSVDFLSLTGSLQMNVSHGAKMFDVFASLQIQNARFFFETMGDAFDGSNSYDVAIDGAFAVPGSKAPQAALLAYAIEAPVHIVGTAGFGLTQFDAVVAPAAVNGSWIGTAHNYQGSLNSQAFPLIVNGSSSTATSVNGVVTQFSTMFEPSLCSPSPCTFNSNGASATGSGSLADLGISWWRFGPGTNVSLVHNFIGGAPNQNAFSVVGGLAETPSSLATIPNLGSNLEGRYSMPIGGTGGFLSYETNGITQPEVPVTWTNREIVITFDDGSMFGDFQATFPGGNLSLFGSGSFDRTNLDHTIGGSGFISSPNISAGGGSPDCSSSCTMFFHSHLVTVGANSPTTLVVATQANTGGSPGATLVDVSVLQDPDGLGVPIP